MSKTTSHERRRSALFGMSLGSSFLLCWLTIVVSSPHLSIVRAQYAALTQSPEKVRRAEEAAAHFQDRFNETLDFGVPYREMYIKESFSRGKTIGTSRAEIEADKLEDDIEIAMMDLWYLRNAYFATHDVQDFPPDIKAAHGEDLMPYMQDEDKTGSSKRTKNVTQRALDQIFRDYLYKARRLANLYRRHLSPAMFSSPLYKARNEEFAKSAGTRRVRVEKSSGYAAFENQDVYKVWHAGIEYWLVEVDGQFKVLHINPLPGFRLGP